MTDSMLAKLHQRLLVKAQDQDGNPRAVSVLDNDSIRPVPVADRAWTQTTYFFFWFSATANVSNLYAASTGLTVGLSMWEAVGCTLAGQILAGILLTLNGRGGAMYRIPFPVLCRASFGPWGAYWPTLNRSVMSIVWNGVQQVQGAQSMYVFLHAIFPGIARIHDTMGPKSALTSGGMICFVVYWFINCAFLVIPIPKMKNLVYVKVAVYYGGVICFVAWTVSRAGGTTDFLRKGSTIHGSEKSWNVARFIFIGLAQCGTFISNAADIQRYTRKPNDVVTGQLFGFPISNLLVAIFGNVIAATSPSIFGELIWNPLELLDRMMEGDRYTPANRAGCAMIALAFVYSTIFSSIFENSISAGNDIAALAPKYITVKRGFFICAVLSFAICPWYLLASASIFITFLASYQIFLAAISGIIICDYYLLRRGNLVIPDLYTAKPGSTYYFFYGWNPNAFAIYIIAVAPSFYGFLHSLGVAAPLGVIRFYYFAYPFTISVAFGGFYILSRWFSCGGYHPMKTGWQEPKDYVGEHDAEGLTLEATPSLNNDENGSKHGHGSSHVIAGV